MKVVCAGGNEGLGSRHTTNDGGPARDRHLSGMWK